MTSFVDFDVQAQWFLTIFESSSIKQKHKKNMQNQFEKQRINWQTQKRNKHLWTLLWNNEKKNLQKRETCNWRPQKDCKLWTHNEKIWRTRFETHCCPWFKKFWKSSHQSFKKCETGSMNTQNLLRTLCLQCERFRDWLQWFLDLHLQFLLSQQQFEFWADRFDESFEQLFFCELHGRTTDDESETKRKKLLIKFQKLWNRDLIKFKNGETNDDEQSKNDYELCENQSKTFFELQLT